MEKNNLIDFSNGCQYMILKLQKKSVVKRSVVDQAKY
jgi:hypothetical protein